ncbi:MAG: BatD family protein [Candidatus Methanoperedens sp.]
MRKLIFVLLILFMFSTIADAGTTKYNFTMQNNTALSFENGSYIIEVIEISKPMYVKVNLTSGGVSRINTLFDSEAPVTFNELKLSSSSITYTEAVIAIEFPSGWSSNKYQIVRPVAPVGVPNIVLTKSVDKTNLNIGDVAEFKIKMENTGNATAYNLTLSELLPNGFSKAPGSIFPPEIPAELAAGASKEVVYALKAVESGTFKIEPASVNYGSKTSKSNSLTIAVAGVTQEKSNLNTDISLDKKNATVGELIKATVKITNTGKATAKSVRVKGNVPLGMEVIDGNLIKDYEGINPAGIEEYRFTLKATEAGNYTIHLITVYNDNEAGMPVDSETITVTEKERNYLYILVPIIIIIAGIVLFTIKRHKEYSY